MDEKPILPLPSTIEGLAVLVADGFKQLHDRMDSTDSVVATEFARLNERLDSTDHRIASIQSQLSGLEVDIRGLKRDVGELQKVVL